MSKLTLIGQTNISTSDRHILYYYDCECGNFILLPKKVVNNGNTKSCGCYKKQVSALSAKKVQHLGAKAAREANRTHGMRNTSFYKHWRGMHDRCNDKNNKYYGMRGIRVCDRWSSFENFMLDMHSSYISHTHKYGYGRKNVSLDRIDGNGNYEPTNCRWATAKVQRLNR